MQTSRVVEIDVLIDTSVFYQNLIRPIVAKSLLFKFDIEIESNMLMSGNKKHNCNGNKK